MSDSRLRKSFIVVLAAFVALTLWAASGRYLPGEQDLLKFIVSHRLAAVNTPALVVSTVGSINIILPLWAILLAASAWRQRRWALRLLPVPLAYPLYTLVKSWVGRPGPAPSLYPWLYDLPLGYFMEGLFRRQIQELPAQGVTLPVVQQPVTAQAVVQVMESGYVSGHALTAAVFYGTLAWLLWKSNFPRRVVRVAVLLPAALAVLVGIVRVYMGIHFPSDVLGAWLLAAIFLLSIDRLTETVAPWLVEKLGLSHSWRSADKGLLPGGPSQVGQ